MSSEVQLAFGLDPATGRMLAVRDVPNGAACGCVCPADDCRQPLWAKNGGREKAPHFAHAPGADERRCTHAPESQWHLLAKQFLADEKWVLCPLVSAECPRRGLMVIEAQPETKFSAVSVNCEPRLIEGLARYVPDAVLTSKTGRRLAVEILFAHKVDADKTAQYAAAGIDCIEIDVSDYRHFLAKSDKFKNVVLAEAPRYWIFSARRVAEEARLLAAHERLVAIARQQVEAEQARAEQRQIEAAAEAERRRLETEEQRRVRMAKQAEEEAERIEVARLVRELRQRELVEAAEKAARQRAIVEERRQTILAKGPEHLTGRLAIALGTPRPWMRISDPDRAAGYFRARALAMLGNAADPIAVVVREEMAAGIIDGG